MQDLKLPDTLRSEDEIVAAWKGNITDPVVSVRCITYNHAPYIEDAIKGFLIQETDFPFEVWIHDDASTDGTREIVEHYQKCYPKIIKTILQDVNQYSQGNKPGQFLNPVCSGKYYALCEGDDFWISPEKLSKQVAIMEENPEVDMCFHLAVRKNMVTGKQVIIGQYRSGDGIVPAEHTIERGHGMIPTASTMIRPSVYKDVEELKRRAKKLIVGDIYVHMFGAKRGGAYLICTPMSCYRHLVPGSYSVRVKKLEGKQIIDKARISINAYQCANQIMGDKFSKNFNKRILITIKRTLKSDLSFPCRISFLLKSTNHLERKNILPCLLYSLVPRFVLKMKRNLSSSKNNNKNQALESVKM